MKFKSRYSFLGVIFLMKCISLHCAISLEELKEKVSVIHQDLYKKSAQDLKNHLGVADCTVTYITAQDLKNTYLDEYKFPFKVINVLPKNLFEDCSIKGSSNVPLKELLDVVETWDKSETIVLYCALSICDASEKAAILLCLLGFENIVEYKGGMKEWYQLGYEFSGSARQSYLHEKAVDKITRAKITCNKTASMHNVCKID